MMQVKKITISFMAVCMQFICLAQIQHVEPLNWWVGMKDPSLQLMINGKDIGNTKPVINYAGVSIKKVTRGDSDNYLFIDLLIGKNTRPGIFSISFKKGEREL